MTRLPLSDSPCMCLKIGLSLLFSVSPAVVVVPPLPPAQFTPAGGKVELVVEWHEGELRAGDAGRRVPMSGVPQNVKRWVNVLSTSDEAGGGNVSDGNGSRVRFLGRPPLCELSLSRCLLSWA